MRKIKTRVLVCVVLLLLLAPILIQPAKALKSGDNLWYEYWGNHKEYGDNPEIVSTTTTVYDETYKHWAKVALVVSVEHYGQYSAYKDTVVFRVALYWDSFAEEGFQPIPANYVNLYLDKDTDGSNLNDQVISMEVSATPAGFHQGRLLDQNIYTDSTYKNREYWALDALSFGVGLFNEPIGVATDLILLAAAWVPGGGVDYQDADWGDLYATSHWRRPQEYDISSLNPVRQYCFNTYRWFLKPDVNPSTYFGLKVSAQVSPADPRFGYYVDLPPVYLRIHRSHTLSISTTSGGNTNPVPGPHVFGVGESVAVTAYPYSGYTFDYWLLDGATVYGRSITVTMDSDHTVKAYFESGGGVFSLTIYASYSPHGGTTNPAPGTYPYSYGESVTVNASAYYDFTFSYWVLVVPGTTQPVTVYGNPITLTMTSDYGLKACFEYIGPGAGGLCPILSVFDGSNYVTEGLLGIHNPDGIDIVYNHTLITEPAWTKGAYRLRLTEHPQTHSYIDQVKLYATLEDGTELELPLIHAWHSEDGNVLPRLLFSDEWKTDTLGANLNNGTSQSIDLKFQALPPNLQAVSFIFQIEGNNAIYKW